MPVVYESELPQVKTWLTRQVRHRRYLIAELIHTTIVARFEGPKSGRFYQVPGTGEWYQASAPKESPAIATGKLYEDWQVYPRLLSNQTGRSVHIGSTLDYARYLEDGTDDIEARPYVNVAVESVLDQIKDIFERPYEYPRDEHP